MLGVEASARSVLTAIVESITAWSTQWRSGREFRFSVWGLEFIVYGLWVRGEGSGFLISGEGKGLG